MKRVIIAALATMLATASVASAQTESDPPPEASAAMQAVLKAEADRIAVFDKAKDAVLAVFAPSGGGGGSGVIISPDGYALTNFHVVKPCGNSMKCGMAGGHLFDAVIVGIDPTGDVALIKLLGQETFPYVELGDSDAMRPGDWCFAMGNPFLLATSFQPTVTYGIISGTHRYQYPSGTMLEYADCIQTDASINPGNSGGPLFDAQGRLIGINGRGSFEKRGRVNVGVAYAISINQIKNFLGYLHSGRIVDHATLGATVSTSEDGRVVVNDILEQSDAWRRGLRYEDEVINVNGRPISTANGFQNAMGIYPKGWRIRLSFRREAERFDVKVRLRGVHGRDELLRKTAGRPRTPPRPAPPKPGDQPKEGEPKDGDSTPKRPKIKPSAQPPRPAAAPLPEIVKKHFEAKTGYANYYFNKLHRDRVFQAWSARSDLSGYQGIWTISGGREGSDDTYRLELTDNDVSLSVPGADFQWTGSDDFSASLLPSQSGGLLPALNLWRRLASIGPEKFGEVYYLGTIPLAGQTELVDVLIGSHKGVQCRFMFDPASGDLLAMEMFPDEDADPCEIYFSGHRDVDGRSLPARMEVRYGDDPFAVFLLDEFTFE